MSIFVFVSFSAVNGISFSSALSFTAENEKCISVGLTKGLGLEIKVLVLILVLKKNFAYMAASRTNKHCKKLESNNRGALGPAPLRQGRR